MDTAAASSGRLVAAASGGLGATRVKAHSSLAYRDAAFTAKPAPSALPVAAAAASTAVSSIAATTGPSEVTAAAATSEATAAAATSGATAAATGPSEATTAAATSGATAAATGPSEASRAAACAGNIADHCYRGTDSLGEKPGEQEAESLSLRPWLTSNW